MYFTLEEDRRIRERISFRDFASRTHVDLGKDKLDVLSDTVALFMEGKTESVYPDFFESPVFLASAGLKKILDMYEPTLAFRTVVLNNALLKTQKIYYLVIADEMDCLREGSEFYLNGWERKAVIDTKKTEGRRVFQVKGLYTRKLYVSLEIAESIMRRGMQGIIFREMEIV